MQRLKTNFYYFCLVLSEMLPKFCKDMFYFRYKNCKLYRSWKIPVAREIYVPQVCLISGL